MPQASEHDAQVKQVEKATNARNDVLKKMLENEKQLDKAKKDAKDGPSPEVDRLQKEQSELRAQYSQSRQTLHDKIQGIQDPKTRQLQHVEARKSHIETHFSVAGRSNRSKGRLGEQLTYDNMRNKGYEFVGSSDSPSEGKGKPQGIDSVWQKTDRKTGVTHYVVIESKYNTSRRKMTEDGKQGSANWTLGRLEQSVGKEKAMEIANAGYYSREYRVLPDGQMKKRTMMNDGAARKAGQPVRRAAAASPWDAKEDSVKQKERAEKVQRKQQQRKQSQGPQPQTKPSQAKNQTQAPRQGQHAHQQQTQMKSAQKKQTQAKPAQKKPAQTTRSANKLSGAFGAKKQGTQKAAYGEELRARQREQRRQANKTKTASQTRVASQTRQTKSVKPK